jgi:hypothetical protein
MLWMLHDCPPPVECLQRWLRSSVNVNGAYGHMLLEQALPPDDELGDALRTYFESAHADAREFFHAEARIDLHPDASAPGAHAQYPGCLPATAQKGLFGEVMAGLMVESFELVGAHRWTIPIFLFRYHTQVGTYIFNLARDPARVHQISGRHGNDFIALGIDPTSGAVVRFIAGEAKWRATLTPAVMNTIMLGELTGPRGAQVRSGNGVWADINTSVPVPEGLHQISMLLRQKAPDVFAEAIVSIDEALLIGAEPLPRTDYVFVAGNKAAKRSSGEAYLPVTAPPADYTAGRDLQVVEMVIEDGHTFIMQLYASLWGGP